MRTHLALAAVLALMTVACGDTRLEPTAVPWTTFSSVSEPSRCYGGRHFAIEFPPSWTAVTAVCDSDGMTRKAFQAESGMAMAVVFLHSLPNYSADPEVAFQRVSEEVGKDSRTRDMLGQVTTMSVVSTAQTTHRGQPAIRQEAVVTEDKQEMLYCSADSKAMFLLSKDWSSDRRTKWAVEVVTTQCQGLVNGYDDEFEGILSSFRLTDSE